MPDHLRQPGPDQRDRQLLLSRPVERGDQGAKLTLFDALHLVNEQDQRGAARLGGLSRNLQEKSCMFTVQLCPDQPFRTYLAVIVTSSLAARGCSVLLSV